MGAITKEEKARRAKLAEQGVKVCGKCKEEKPFEEFSKSKSRKDGFHSECRGCVKKFKQENKEHIRKKEKQYRQENKTHISEYNKKYWKENKDYFKQYNSDLKNKCRRRDWHREKLKSDPMFRLKRVINSIILNAIKRNGFSKNSKTQSIVGCSYEHLLLWLGDAPSKECHCDHVIPQSLAKTEEELYLLNHYTNLQLLSSEENLSKNNRYIRKSNLDRVLANHPNPDRLKEIVNREKINIK